MIYFKAVGGRSVNVNVKPVQRSPSVSVVCQCVFLFTNIMQMRHTNTVATDGVRAPPNVSNLLYGILMCFIMFVISCVLLYYQLVEIVFQVDVGRSRATNTSVAMDDTRVQPNVSVIL